MDIWSFRAFIGDKKIREAREGQSVHLAKVDEKLLGVPEHLLYEFAVMVEALAIGEVTMQDIVTINQLLDCFTKVLTHRANDGQSHQAFREYIRNLLAIKLATLQMAKRPVNANRQ